MFVQFFSKNVQPKSLNYLPLHPVPFQFQNCDINVSDFFEPYSAWQNAICILAEINL